MRVLLPPCIALLLGATPASAQFIGFPSAATSTVNAALTPCPNGEIHFRGVVRDVANNVVANATVYMDFTPCPQVVLCPRLPTSPYQITGRAVFQLTDALGRFDFPLRAGGGCAEVQFVAETATLALRPVASFDQNGDRVVNAIDVDLATAKLGGSDRTADFDGNGTVSETDLALLAPHVAHACDMPVIAHPRSWGALKTIYR